MSESDLNILGIGILIGAALVLSLKVIGDLFFNAKAKQSKQQQNQ